MKKIDKSLIFVIVTAIIASFQASNAMQQAQQDNNNFNPGMIIASSLEELTQKGFIRNNNPLGEMAVLFISEPNQSGLDVQSVRKPEEVPAMRIPNGNLIVIKNPQDEKTFVLARVIRPSISKTWHLEVALQNPTKQQQKVATFAVPSADVFIHISDLKCK